MDRDLEKRLDRLEAKLDKLIQAQDPRLVTSAYGQEVLKQATEKSEKQRVGKMDGGAM